VPEIARQGLKSKPGKYQNILGAENREKLDGLTNSVPCRKLASNERGDRTIIESLKGPREEEVLEVVWLLIGNNQSVCSQGAFKMVAEVWEWRLSGWREEMSAE
jgi:hypothetical protein